MTSPFHDQPVTRAAATLVLVALVAAPSTVSAQAEREQRPVRGLFGGGEQRDPELNRHESMLRVSLFGGYEDNLSADVDPSDLLLEPSGYLGSTEVGVGYLRQGLRRSFEFNVRGFVNTLPSPEIRPSEYFVGGEVRGQFQTGLGRRAALTVAHSHRYDPRYEMRSVQSSPSDGPLPVESSNPSNVLVQQPSWASTTTGALTHQWSRITKLEGSLELERRTFTAGAPFESRIIVGVASLDRSLSRNWGLRAAYRHSDGDFVELGGIPLTGDGQTLELGLRHAVQLSSTRRLDWTAGAGMSRISTSRSSAQQAVQYWEPSAYGTARLAFARSWSVTTDYLRTVAVLPGITAETFVTDEVALRTAGFVQPRLETALTVGYLMGRAGPGVEGEYETYRGEAQMRVHLTRWWSLGVTYNYFEYLSSGIAGGPLGASRHVQRNTTRVHMDWSLPLYGTF
ncbi:MAG: hypothetical protein AB7F99_05295 [Vicinamibacterales bacterium]